MGAVWQSSRGKILFLVEGRKFDLENKEKKMGKKTERNWAGREQRGKEEEMQACHEVLMKSPYTLDTVVCKLWLPESSSAAVCLKQQGGVAG